MPSWHYTTDVARPIADVWEHFLRLAIETFSDLATDDRGEQAEDAVNAAIAGVNASFTTWSEADLPTDDGRILFHKERSIEYRSEDDKPTRRFSYRFEPTDTGTLVTHDVEMEVRGINSLLMLVGRPLFGLEFRNGLRDAKTTLEDNDEP